MKAALPSLYRGFKLNGNLEGALKLIGVKFLAQFKRDIAQAGKDGMKTTEKIIG